MTHSESPRHLRRRAQGFTLIELLVVIGIILLLVGLLIPVIRRVQQSARQADTLNFLATISNGIQRYYDSNNAYPGIFANSQIGSTDPNKYGLAQVTPPITSVTLGTDGITSSENLVASLSGAINLNAAGTAPVYAQANYGLGAFSLNPLSRKRLAPYVDVSINDTTLNYQNPRVITFVPGQWTTRDSTIPEYVDRFGSPMPILYLRAKVGATGISMSDNTLQYNYTHMLPYTYDAATTTTIEGAAGIFHNASGAIRTDTKLPFDFASANAYFVNSAVPTTPKQKDAYLLISAGIDRKYGTKDDILNTGVIGK